jgi:hypothetical protein
MPILKEIPLIAFHLVGNAASVLAIPEGEPVERENAQTFVFQTLSTEEDIMRLRSGDSGAGPMDYFIVDINGIITPIQLCLARCEFVHRHNNRSFLRYSFAEAARPVPFPKPYKRPKLFAHLPIL